MDQNKDLSIEEKVSKIVNGFRGIDIGIKEKVSDVLASIKENQSKVERSYIEVCDEIEAKLFSILEQCNLLKIESIKIDSELLSKEQEFNKYCSIYAKVPPLQEQKSDKDYQFFLEKYKRNCELTEQISKLNLLASNLLGIQKELDNSYADTFLKLDYLLKIVKGLAETSKNMRTPSAIENYKRDHCGMKKLESIVAEKEREIELINEKLKI